MQVYMIYLIKYDHYTEDIVLCIQNGIHCVIFIRS
jgi:hypothetical protein